LKVLLSVRDSRHRRAVLQSKDEQSKDEQSRAEQSRAEQSKAKPLLRIGLQNWNHLRRNLILNMMILQVSGEPGRALLAPVVLSY
jgi:hypothetical protein